MMLKNREAAVWRTFPFTIILKSAMPDAVVKPLAVKLDPGSKTTGIAIVDSDGEVVSAAELTHRGQAIKGDLESRKAIRRGRRNRKTRYRAPRSNARRCNGVNKQKLPPSLQHRVITTMTWVDRFRRICNVEELSVERVKFDMQLMRNPDVAGKEYQQGTLLGYTVREYLLEKHNRTCAYCGAKDTPLQVEHVVPKAKGGTNSITNLTLACGPCNTKKGAKDLKDFVKDPKKLASIKAKVKATLKDAAAVNATRNAIFVALLNTGLPVETGTGAQTKMNRVLQNLPKDHWVDAACVGDSGSNISIPFDINPLKITAMGRGNRHMCGVNKYGFPTKAPKGKKSVNGVSTGDYARIVQTKGKYVGSYFGRIVSINTTTNFIAMKVNEKAVSFNSKLVRVTQKNDGYNYEY
jgi:5-methylcytosine-specific restriction endonuclease McrA